MRMITRSMRCSPVKPWEKPMRKYLGLLLGLAMIAISSLPTYAADVGKPPEKILEELKRLRALVLEEASDESIARCGNIVISHAIDRAFIRYLSAIEEAILAVEERPLNGPRLRLVAVDMRTARADVDEQLDRCAAYISRKLKDMRSSLR